MYLLFLLHIVMTYRSSAADPNLQNAPKRDKEIMDICRRALTPASAINWLRSTLAGSRSPSLRPIIKTQRC